MALNELSNVGNPTRSAELNDLVKCIKKKNVRKQGISSKTRRALLNKEFKTTIFTVEDHKRTAEGASTKPIWNYGVPT